MTTRFICDWCHLDIVTPIEKRHTVKLLENNVLMRRYDYHERCYGEAVAALDKALAALETREVRDGTG